MDIGKKDIAGRSNDPHIVLNMQRDLEIVAPIPAFMTVVGQDRIVEKDLEPIEIRPQAIEYDDIRRDQKKIARKGGVGFVKSVEVAPRYQQ